MNQCKSCQFIYIILIITVAKSNAGSDNDNDDKEIDNLPSDFVQFVSGLDKMVFKKDTKSSTSPQPRPLKQKKSTSLRRSNDLRTTQNGALRDMLMMKLVSYYEDKYKVERNLLTSPRLPEVIRHIPRTRTRPYNSRRVQHPDDGPLLHDYGQVNDNWALNQNQNPEYTQDHNTLDQNFPVSPTVVEEVVVI